MEFDPTEGWENAVLDKKLGIVWKFYPTWLRPFSRQRMDERPWDKVCCLCTDGKYYVIDRHAYDKMGRRTFENHRIGPYRSESEATCAAEMLSHMENGNA